MMLYEFYNLESTEPCCSLMTIYLQFAFVPGLVNYSPNAIRVSGQLQSNKCLHVLIKPLLVFSHFGRVHNPPPVPMKTGNNYDHSKLFNPF
jgi:hypothetical protein